MQRKANIVCRLQTKIHYCSALCHRGWTDERLGQDQEETEGEFAIGGEGIRRREGWEMREKRSEGGGEREAWCASESKVKSPLIWQLPACTLLFSWLPATWILLIAASWVLCIQVKAGLHTEVGCFTCDTEAKTEWAHWSGCVRASVWQTVDSGIGQSFQFLSLFRGCM